MIKVTYDSEVDAKYVSIKEGEVCETKIINDWLFYDLNKEGDILGVEILDSSKNEVVLSTFDNKLSGINFVKNITNEESLSKKFEVKGGYLKSDSVVLA